MTNKKTHKQQKPHFDFATIGLDELWVKKALIILLHSSAAYMGMQYHRVACRITISIGNDTRM